METVTEQYRLLLRDAGRLALADEILEPRFSQIAESVPTLAV